MQEFHAPSRFGIDLVMSACTITAVLRDASGDRAGSCRAAARREPPIRADPGAIAIPSRTGASADDVPAPRGAFDTLGSLRAR